ncbi:MAG: hypothetical protein CEN89_256 [Candidatus Berkelbacteria bacterium Licking1014_7]|uniref:dolichyl-phosphate beta-glucosyltransferase n=1 Tax=Candidatus Berkelbacteria bacterium Licking1014_7 TaxID=2017147 RepID=A0A554LJV1_9BACT|nr:MAG: hypothetical protein CEN89_256 [Candidatus Berkelbacteria bacterium Licking1014_7]
MNNNIYLSVIIPAYNEAHRLPKTLEKTYEYLKKQKYLWEIIVVDDGSTDETVAKTELLAKKIPNLRVIANKANHGKGYVVKQAMLEAKGEWRLFTDADNSTPIDQIEKLWKFKNEFGVIIGSRHLQKGSIKTPPPWYREVISWGSNLLIQIMAVPGIKDTQCGFKLFSSSATEKIFPLQTIDRWSFDVEILAIARKLKIPIKEVAVDWYNSPESKVRAIRALARSLIELIKIWWRMQFIK